VNIFQKIRHWLFGTEYVILRHHDGEHQLKEVDLLGDHWFAAPYLPKTRCRLLPDLSVDGPSYVIGWYPVTDGVRPTSVENKQVQDDG